MSDSTKRIDPLGQAILGLLCRLPLRWEPFDTERLTGTGQEALKRLTRAGLVEERIRVRASMDGFPQTVHMQVCVSGEYENRDMVAQMFNAVPEWLDEHGRTRGQFRLQSHGVVQVRLNDQGELARRDYESNSPEYPSFVLAFVQGIGPLGLPRPKAKSRVVVESCRVETTKPPPRQDEKMDHHRQRRPSLKLKVAESREVTPTSASHATATVGDITVHNHFHVEAGAVMESVLKQLAEQQAAAQACPPKEVPSTPGAAPTTREAPDDRHDRSPRARWPRERIEMAVRDYLQRHKATYRQLGQDCLDGRPDAAAKFRRVFGPTAMAGGINEMLHITDPSAQCRRQDVSRTRTYQTMVRPLPASPPQRPEGWVSADDSGSAFEDILDDIHGVDQP